MYDRLLHGGRVANISRQRDCALSGLQYLAHDSIAARCVLVEHSYCGAFPGESQCYPAADTAAATGDDRNFAF
jgi:hypothetical protein